MAGVFIFPSVRQALLLAPICGACSRAPKATPVRVYAAASTTDALQEALAAFDAGTSAAPEAIVGSSSAMARQIEHGAPADLFLSANHTWMQHLVDQGNIGPEAPVELLENSLVVVVPKGTAHPGATTDASSLTALIGDGRLAMGDPAHVPAGIYAQAALQSLGAWRTVEPQLARTNDVRAALALVERAEVPAGIVYATDAEASDQVDIVSTLPSSAHPPIVYPLGIVRTRGVGVREVYEHLLGPRAAAIFQAHGFRRR